MRRGLTGVIALGLACTPSAREGEREGQPEPVEACVVGWWLSSALECSGAGSFACDGATGARAEVCELGDCVNVNAAHYDGDTEAIIGMVWSENSRRFAALEELPRTLPYTVVDETLLVYGDDGLQQDLSCDEQSLVIGGFRPTRATPAVASALDAALAGGTFSDVRY